jgi:hypothetical protein
MKRRKRYAQIALGWITWKAMRQIARQQRRSLARGKKKKKRR